MSKKNSWICKNCSEIIDKEFDSCWNCGTSKDGKKSQSFDSANQKIQKQNSISESDFTSLKSFQVLLSVIVIIYFVGLSILAVIFFKGGDIPAGFFTVLSLILFTFIIYNISLMIDFLFYLEKNKKVKFL